jgi:hypothetical protein
VTDPRVLFERHFRRGLEAKCWPWIGSVNHGGYGVFGARGRRNSNAHYWSYVFYVGEVPPGLEIDHVCHNRRCVNPAHLRAVTRHENLCSRANTQVDPKFSSTQVAFRGDLRADLARLAAQDGRSFSAVVRLLARDGIARRRVKRAA